MPIDIDTIINQMSENTNNLIKKFSQLQKKTKDFSNEVSDEKVEEESNKISDEKVEEESNKISDEEVEEESNAVLDNNADLDKARLQIYNFNLNFERIKNFVLQKKHYDNIMKNLLNSKTKITKDLHNLSENRNSRAISNNGLKIFAKKLRSEQKIEEEKIEKTKVSVIKQFDDLAEAIKSRINSNRDFEGIFDSVPEEHKSKTTTQDDILREGIKKYQISIVILRKWKEEFDLDKKKYHMKYGSKDINYEGELQKQEQQKALNIIFQNLDMKVNDYFDKLKTDAEIATSKELQKLYTTLDEKAEIKGFGKAWSLLNQVTDEEKNQITNESLLKDDFYDLAIKERTIFKQEILEIIGKKKELSKSDLALLKNEKRIIREKVKTRLKLSSLNCSEGKILKQFAALQEQREITAKKVDKKATSFFKMSGPLSTIEYDKEKEMTKNHLEAIKDAKIRDFLETDNLSDCKILDMLYQSSIEDLERHLYEKDVEIWEKDNKETYINLLKTVEIKIDENQKKWKNFQTHELAEIEFYSKPLNEQQLIDEDLAQRWLVLPDELNLGKKMLLSSKRTKNFNSWDTFEIPHREIVDDEDVLLAMDKSPECPQNNPKDDLSNNPKFFPFPKNEEEWSNQESQALENVIECKKQQLMKEREKLQAEEKQLREQLAEILLKQHNTLNSIKKIDLAQEQQKWRAEEAEKQKLKAQEEQKKQVEAAKNKAKAEDKRKKSKQEMTPVAM